MSSGNSWGMIIGAAVGVGLAFMTAGTSLAFSGWLAANMGAAMYGAAIGASIGGLAGGLISPADFNGPEVQGPRLEELQLTAVSEGSGVTKCYGQHNRVAGMMIAAGNLKETKHVEKNPVKSGKSFVAGTLIQLASGQEIPIEDVRVGDLLTTAHHSWLSKLLGKDPRFRRKRVEAVHKGTATKAIKVCADFDNKDIKNVEFTCTPEHEVYGYKVDRKPHWFQAQGLKKGDALYTENGWVRVVSCDRFGLNESVYNLTVAGDHNYLAGGALVHNGGGGGEGVHSVTTWYTYSCDFAVAVCEGPIHNIEKIYLNGKRRYYRASDKIIQIGSGGVTQFSVYLYAEPISGTESHQVENQFRYIARVSCNAGATTPFSGWTTGMRASTSGGHADWSGESDRKITRLDSSNKDWIEIEVSGSTVGSQQGNQGWWWRYEHTFSGFHNPTTVSLYNNIVNSTTDTETSSNAKIYSTTVAYNDATATAIRTYIGDDGVQNANALVIEGEGAWNTGSWNNGGTSEHFHNKSADSVVTQIYANSPAYRGICYVVFDDLELKDFGNQLPQCNFEVDAQAREPEYGEGEVTEETTVGQVLDSIMIRAGRYKKEGIGGVYNKGDQFNTNEFQGDVSESGYSNLLRGYAVVGAKTTQSALANLVIRYDILASEISGVLTFTRRGQEGSGEVLQNQLGAYTDPEQNAQEARFGTIDQPDTNLPNEINVTYLDRSDDYQKGSQKSIRSLSGLPRVDTIELPLTMTSGEAQAVATRVLYQTWSQRQSCNFKLPPNFITVNENDMITVHNEAEAYKVRVLEINRGVDYVHEIRGLVAESEASPYHGEGDEGDGGPDGVYTPPPMDFYALDAPAMHPEGINHLGHYLWACTSEIDQEWKGAVIYWSNDNFNSYEVVTTYTTEAMVVMVEDAIPDGPVGVWDDDTTIRIEIKGPLSGDAPSTTSAEQVLSGLSNHLYIGGELIGFKTVEAVTSQTYDLSNLIRGRRGTVDSMASHGDYERGCIVTHEGSGGVTTSTFGEEFLGNNVYYKIVPYAGELSDNQTISITLGSRRKKSFPVGSVYGQMGGDNDYDWNIRFSRCDRSFDAKPLFGIVGTPNTDGTEIYICDVYKNDGETWLRTITMEASDNGSVITPTETSADGIITGLPKVFYSGTDYITDLGAGAEDSIWVEIKKIGMFVGVGGLHEITKEWKHEV